MTSKFRAEIIAIGDEMTSGQRLDTNTQWLSQQLGELGIEVAFHSTVGDDLKDNVDVFRIAANRADIVISTGGLGPTQDDLTRQALADLANVELEFHPEAWERIQQIFAHYKREIPANNKVQAYAPRGSQMIPNPEGTAPGVDLEFPRPGKTPSRIFSVPGVPAEMKQMWDSYVESNVREIVGQTGVIHHHVVHCFGVGESRAEEMLPDLIRRGREPRVGITASSAVISLRVTAQGESREACLQLMDETIETIHREMGEYVFGENGETLEWVAAKSLQQRELSLAIVDLGLNGDAARSISACDGAGVLVGSKTLCPRQTLDPSGHLPDQLADLARSVAKEIGADLGLAIGPIDRDDEIVRQGKSLFHIAIQGDGLAVCEEQRFGGHSAMREKRAVNQVFNLVRLKLAQQ